MKLYLYCLAEGVDRLDKASRGVSGAAVRVIKIDDFSVLVSAYGGDVSAALNKNALAHNAVVRSVFTQTTPLPFRFGTLVEEEQLRSYVKTHRQALKNRLAHVRGCAEMNLRLIGPRKNAPPAPERAQPLGPGTKFLLDKRRELCGEEWRVEQTGELSTWLADKLGDLIRDEKIHLVPAESVLLAKVDHLVDRVNIPQYREKMAKAIAERPELRFMVSGPWPPYSFANIELEFSRQFGVI